MKLKCTKNLVIANQLLIMKHDIVEVLNMEVIDSKAEPTMYFDMITVVSNMAGEGMEFSLHIKEVAEHFEYLEIVTKHTTITNC